MIINKNSTIAYKCPVCGSIEFDDVSIFDFSGKREHTITCGCKDSSVNLTMKRNKQCTIAVPCIACSETHAFTIPTNALWNNNIMSFSCPNTGMGLCFIGKDDIVRTSVDDYEIQMDLLLNDIGYDDDFLNNTVMLNTIDRIHDIAGKGNLLCQCGSHDIELEVLYDCVALMCNKCQTCEVINARTNKDLKETQERESIILCHDSYGVGK